MHASHTMCDRLRASLYGMISEAYIVATCTSDRSHGVRRTPREKQHLGIWEDEAAAG